MVVGDSTGVAGPGPSGIELARCRAGVAAVRARLAAHSVSHETKPLGERGDVLGRIGKLLTNLRKVQEQPLWENRDFGDRRYAWAFRGGPILPANDEGDDYLLPVPVDQILGKR